MINRITAGVAAVAAMVLPLAPTNANATTGEDTASLAKSISQLKDAGIDPSTLRPGWTLRDGWLLWDGGDVMASVEPMSYAACDSTYLCFYADKEYTGRMLQFHDSGLRGDMRDYSFNDQMSSFRSRITRDARWYYDYGGTGTTRCIESGTANSDVGAGAFNFDNDEMSSFRIYAGDAKC